MRSSSTMRAGGTGGSPPRPTTRPMRSPHSRSAGSTASRSRASSARRNSGGCRFALNADTLVPRPETETVVEAALAALGDSARGRALRIADLGTGSGALLLALLSELPAAHGVGTDISLAALACARSNAAALGLAGRASFVACDHGAALAWRLRSDRRQPALRGERRHRGAGAGGARLRSARARSTAVRTGSRPIAPLPAMRAGCWRPAACWCSSSAPDSATPWHR